MTLAIRCAVVATAALFAISSASAAEKRFGLTSFEAIEVSADYAIEITTRAPVGAVATGPSDALDRLSLEARDGRLVIGERQFAGDENRRAPRGAVTIRINVANLRSATMGGAGSLKIDRLKGTRVVIGLRGPGTLTVGRIETDRLSVAMIGNGTMAQAGVRVGADQRVGRRDVRCRGAGRRRTDLRRRGRRGICVERRQKRYGHHARGRQDGSAR